MAEHAHDIEHALGLCTFCPSLCRHACPVATAEGSDTVSPWGMMSLAGHVRAGRVAVDDAVMSTLQACNGCGACTEACLLQNPVMETLVAVRAELARTTPNQTARYAAAGDAPAVFEAGLDAPGGRGRYEARPAVSLVPGRDAPPALVEGLFALCDRLDLDPIALGDLGRMDLGYDAWLAGDHAHFLELAKRAHAATAGARDVVVMSGEALFLLRQVYPRFGLTIEAEILHVSEMLLPLLSGAVVRRLSLRVGYHESCHLSRHLGLREVPRQVLRRVLDGPLYELPRRAEIIGCCGGSGRVGARLDTTERMADVVLEAAAEAGLERLASFSTECVTALSAAEARRRERGLAPVPRVDHALSLVAEAVVGDGAAA